MAVISRRATKYDLLYQEGKGHYNDMKATAKRYPGGTTEYQLAMVDQAIHNRPITMSLEDFFVSWAYHNFPREDPALSGSRYMPECTLEELRNIAPLEPHYVKDTVPDESVIRVMADRCSVHDIYHKLWGWPRP